MTEPFFYEVDQLLPDSFPTEGIHNHIAPRLMDLLREKGLDDVLVVIGGIIPDVDIPKLKAIGVRGIFLPGTPMQEIIEFINANVRTRV